MNCEQCQRQLLNCQDVDHLAVELQAHLAECMACRQWQRRLLQIESNVRSLPIPASTAKQAFQQQILLGPISMARPHRPRWRWAAAGFAGLSAACVLIAAGFMLADWLSGPAPNSDIVADNTGPQAKPQPTLVSQLVALDVTLAEAETPRRRVETLAKLADSLHGESQSLAKAAGSKELDSLAQLYGQVVREGLVPRARKLPVEQRKETLNPIVSQLERTQKEARARAETAAPAAARTFEVIAAAAQAGDLRLRALMDEVTP
jgi:hypothetical protein